VKDVCEKKAITALLSAPSTTKGHGTTDRGLVQECVSALEVLPKTITAVAVDDVAMDAARVS